MSTIVTEYQPLTHHPAYYIQHPGFGDKLVQIEAQFGKVESMFKDFCGFRIVRSEKRLALGNEIVMSNPGEYFSHRKKSISGMAYIRIAKKTLPAIDIECPIWVVGIREKPMQFLETNLD